MGADRLTVRGDGKFIAEIFVGSRVATMPSQTFLRQTRRGKAALHDYLVDLWDYEGADRLLRQTRGCEIVTIQDEYLY